MLCGVGSLLVLDPIHRLAQGQFREKFGFPSWFVPCVGLCEVSIAYLNFYGGPNQWIAQKLLATLMGGAVYTHIKLDQSLPGAVAALAFFYASCAVPLPSAPDARCAPLIVRAPFPQIPVLEGTEDVSSVAATHIGPLPPLLPHPPPFVGQRPVLVRVITASQCLSESALGRLDSHPAHESAEPLLHHTHS